MILSKEMLGLRVKLTWGLWVNFRKGINNPVPAPFQPLFEKWIRGGIGIGVIVNLRPKQNSWGRHPYEFQVDFQDESWWLPRGSFELVSHGKVAGMPIVGGEYRVEKKVSAPAAPSIAQAVEPEPEQVPLLYTKIKVDPIAAEVDAELLATQKAIERGEVC